MTWIFDITEMTESFSKFDRTIRQVRLAKLRIWSHKPSFNLRIANLHAGKMCNGHIFPLRPRPLFEHTRTPTKWWLVTRMLGLGRIVAAAKTDEARAEAYKTLAADAGLKREVDAFRQSVEARFGEEGARAMARAAAAGKAFTHASVPKAQQSVLDAAAKLYAGERLVARAAEAERLSARQTQGAKLKPS